MSGAKRTISICLAVAICFLDAKLCCRFQSRLAPLVLHLEISPLTISAVEFRENDKFDASLILTNHSQASFQFPVNGINIFKHVAINIRDSNGNNHATMKYGDMLAVSLAPTRTDLLHPGESRKTSIPILLACKHPLVPGAYTIQSQFSYKEISILSNKIGFSITP